MKRFALTALFTGLFGVVILVAMWLIGSFDDQGQTCFAGYMGDGWYGHSTVARDHPNVSGTQSAWLCSAGEMRYFGLKPPEGATILNAGG